MEGLLKGKDERAEFLCVGDWGRCFPDRAEGLLIEDLLHFHFM